MRWAILVGMVEGFLTLTLTMDLLSSAWSRSCVTRSCHALETAVSKKIRISLAKLLWMYLSAELMSGYCSGRRSTSHWRLHEDMLPSTSSASCPSRWFSR